ncbi:hypothetical protein V8C26DRAFT_400153 [Trichoderma gracile]
MRLCYMWLLWLLSVADSPCCLLAHEHRLEEDCEDDASRGSGVSDKRRSAGSYWKRCIGCNSSDPVPAVAVRWTSAYGHAKIQAALGRSHADACKPQAAWVTHSQAVQVITVSLAGLPDSRGLRTRDWAMNRISRGNPPRPLTSWNTS